MDHDLIKRDFTEDQIIQIALDLGSDGFVRGRNNEPIFQTICHNATGGSYKLYFYEDTQMFHCYTQCGDSFNVYELVMRNRECDFGEALRYIYNLLEIKKIRKAGFIGNRAVLDDWEVFSKYNEKSLAKEKFAFPSLSNTLLDFYYDTVPVEWLKEGIAQTTLRKFNIRYDLIGNKIIIPHYDIDGTLIGIRGRALNQYEVDQGKKYMPVTIGKDIMRHPTAFALYGLNFTAQSIQASKKAMIFEAEKSVLKCDGFYGEGNFTVAACGSNISNYQRDLILNLGVTEVFIAFDKEYHEPFSKESDDYSEKILYLASKFAPYVTTWILWDTEGLLDYKDAPCDKGQVVLEKLMKQKFEVVTKEE